MEYEDKNRALSPFSEFLASDFFRFRYKWRFAFSILGSVL